MQGGLPAALGPRGVRSAFRDLPGPPYQHPNVGGLGGRGHIASNSRPRMGDSETGIPRPLGPADLLRGRRFRDYRVQTAGARAGRTGSRCPAGCNRRLPRRYPSSGATAPPSLPGDQSHLTRLFPPPVSPVHPVATRPRPPKLWYRSRCCPAGCPATGARWRTPQESTPGERPIGDSPTGDGRYPHGRDPGGVRPCGSPTVPRGPLREGRHAWWRSVAQRDSRNADVPSECEIR